MALQKIDDKNYPLILYYNSWRKSIPLLKRLFIYILIMKIHNENPDKIRKLSNNMLDKVWRIFINE